MALSGEFAGTTNSQYIRPSIAWSAKQSVSGNYSDVTATLVYSRTNTGYTTYGTGTFSVTINGTRYTATKEISISYWSGTVAISNTVRVPHNADGTKSCAISATGSIPGTSLSSTTISGTVTLDTIPRATTPSISGAHYLGNTITITLDRASSSFTHNLYYSWGSQVSNVLIGKGIATSQKFTIPKTLSEYIMGSTSGYLYIRCDTYNGSTLIGTKTVSYLVFVPDTAEFKPTVSSVSVGKANTIAVDRLVVGKSKLKISVNAVGAYVSGSPNRNSFLQKATVVVDGVTYTATLGQNASQNFDITTETISQSGAKTITVTVTDSRGRTATKNATYTAYNYSAPVISTFTAQRCAADGTADDSGVYVLFGLKATVSSIDSQNAKTYKIVYENNGSEVTLKTGTLSAYSNAMVSYNSSADSKTFSVDNAWIVRAYVYDSFNTSTPAVATVIVPTEKTFMDWRANGNGLAFGKVSTKDGLEIAWPLFDRNDFGVGITSRSIGEGYGYVKFESGMLLQWGTVTITPTAANTVTSLQITFDHAYSVRPHIGGALQSNVPQVITWGVGGGTTAAAALTSMMLYMTRTNVNATTFRWWALGLA